MDGPRFNKGYGHDASTTPDFREPASASAFSPKRLFQLGMLRGEHPTIISEACVKDDVQSKRFVQSFAIGEVDNMRHMAEGKGPKTVSKMVGWIRARIADAHGGEAAHADIDGVHVDPTVDAGPLEDFLVGRLQEKILRSRRRIAALHVRIPVENYEGAVRYLSHGFDYSFHDPETFTWIPQR